MVKCLTRKFLRNKRNNQISITIPKNKIKIDLKRAKGIKIKDWEFFY